MTNEHRNFMTNEYRDYETKALIELDESLDYYIHELVLEICDRAGLMEEYKSSNEETFESVMDRALEILKEEHFQNYLSKLPTQN